MGPFLHHHAMGPLHHHVMGPILLHHALGPLLLHHAMGPPVSPRSERKELFRRLRELNKAIVSFFNF